MDKLNEILDKLWSLYKYRYDTESIPICLTRDDVNYLIFTAKNVFESESILLQIPPPIHICGDVHGKFFDLLRLLSKVGSPSKIKYLFLGNYVDKGVFGIECLAILLAYKIKYPNNVFLLRGNHEDANVFGFKEFGAEVRFKYPAFSGSLIESFSHLFEQFSIGAVIGQRILCVHGGISRKLFHLNSLREVDKPCRINIFNQHDWLLDLLWSDPVETTHRWSFNMNRKISICYGKAHVKEFLKINHLDQIIRSHEPVNGRRKYFSGRVISINSMPSYERSLKGVVLILDENLRRNYLIFERGYDNVRSMREPTGIVEPFYVDMNKRIESLFRAIERKLYVYPMDNIQDGPIYEKTEDRFFYLEEDTMQCKTCLTKVDEGMKGVRSKSSLVGSVKKNSENNQDEGLVGKTSAEVVKTASNEMNSDADEPDQVSEDEESKDSGEEKSENDDFDEDKSGASAVEGSEGMSDEENKTEESDKEAASAVEESGGSEEEKSEESEKDEEDNSGASAVEESGPEKKSEESEEESNDAEKSGASAVEESGGSGEEKSEESEEKSDEVKSGASAVEEDEGSEEEKSEESEEKSGEGSEEEKSEEEKSGASAVEEDEGSEEKKSEESEEKSEESEEKSGEGSEEEKSEESEEKSGEGSEEEKSEEEKSEEEKSEEASEEEKSEASAAEEDEESEEEKSDEEDESENSKAETPDDKPVKGDQKSKFSMFGKAKEAKNDKASKNEKAESKGGFFKKQENQDAGKSMKKSKKNEDVEEEERKSKGKISSFFRRSFNKNKDDEEKEGSGKKGKAKKEEPPPKEKKEGFFGKKNKDKK